MELHGDGGQDLLNVRSLSTVTEVSEATSFAYADGEGVQQPASCKYSMRRDTLSFQSRHWQGLARRHYQEQQQ